MSYTSNIYEIKNQITPSYFRRKVNQVIDIINIILEEKSYVTTAKTQYLNKKYIL